MAYEPLSLTKFKHLLEAGQYQSVTGARRAIGKASAFTAADKSSAGKLIDKMWPDAGSPAPKAAPKAAKKVVAKAPKAEKPVKAAKAAPAAAPKKMGRPKGSTAKEPALSKQASVDNSAAPLQATPAQALLIGERIVASGTMALNASNTFGTNGQTVGKEAVALIGRGVKLLRNFVDAEIDARTPAPAKTETPKKAESKAVTNGAASVEPTGQQVFESTLPS